MTGGHPVFEPGGVVLAMAGAHRGGFAGRIQFLQRVVADRFQHPVARGLLGVVGHHKRFVHQPDEVVDDLVAWQVSVAGDRVGGIEVESAQKHCQPAKYNLFRFAEQVVRPIH